MNRRDFLRLSALAAVAPLVDRRFLWPGLVPLALNRLDYWAPTTDPTILVEWRFTVGRITDGDQDFGFVVSISDVEVIGAQSNTLTVQRQDFGGDQLFAGNLYNGQLAYNDASATYTFKDDTDQELATWQWDESAQAYKLTITTAELTLANVRMIPQGALIPEGGDGQIRAGRLGTIIINSAYYGDWAILEIGGAEKGVARIDMQGLRPAEISAPVNASDDYDHHWFAIAADLNDGAPSGDDVPAWISAWKIEDLDGPFWGLTIARGSNASWTVTSLTEEDEASIAAPLTITTLNWQNLPASTGLDQSAGAKWRLTAGAGQPNDLIDIQLSVPAGQFITDDTRIISDWLEEAVGVEVEGTVLGSPISSVKMVAAESSTEFGFIFLPVILGNISS
jgi:hypothetical protein